MIRIIVKNCQKLILFPDKIKPNREKIVTLTAEYLFFHQGPRLPDTKRSDRILAKRLGISRFMSESESTKTTAAITVTSPSSLQLK